MGDVSVWIVAYGAVLTWMKELSDKTGELSGKQHFVAF